MGELKSRRKELDTVLKEQAANSDKLDELSVRKSAVENNVRELREARVKATLDGTEFRSKGELAALVEDQAVIGDAITELESRDAILAEKRRLAEKRFSMVNSESQLHGHADEYLKHVAEAETSVKVAVDAIERAVAIGDDLAALVEKLPRQPGVAQPGHPVSRFSLQSRLGARLSRQLKKISGAGRLGPLQWTPEQDRDEDWVEEERIELMRHFDGCVSAAARADPEL